MPARRAMSCCRHWSRIRSSRNTRPRPRSSTPRSWVVLLAGGLPPG
jgi:hypothetical protein